MEKILVKVKTDKEIREEFLECFSKRAEIVFCDNETNSNDLETATVILGEPTEAELSKCKNLKLLQLTWAGADKFLKMKNFPKNTTLATASGAFGEVISEYVIGGILALYRDFPTYFENQKNHVWQKNGIVETISGKTVLILGVGDIGRTTAKKLKALGAKEIFGVRRNSKEDFVENFNEIFDIMELDFLLPKADIVICCLPETKVTIGVLNEEMLSLMKENSVLVNVGRGSLIVTND
ncbi:MAG: D-2-hydroxyacid dehydrogenase, partial [Clostridia bacterium]|nr:D-2-hydroxyacid dehydrogenase [Clostridia bacterium]